VFAYGAGSLEFGPEFLTSFPVNGVDGTLFSRLRNLPPGAFRGKTGTLNDTCAITGVLTTVSGRRIALAIMLEIPRGTAWSARAWQDSLISAMHAGF
jgi:D-alanyl-D-alanine carboxypeptidase